MKVIEGNLLPPSGFKALTIGPWIFVRPGTTLTEVDINHEAIHWEQYKETLIIGFLLIYGISWVIEVIRCMINHDRGAAVGRKRSLWKRAYRSICFEREAYANEENLEYIKGRRRWAWL